MFAADDLSLLRAKDIKKIFRQQIYEAFNCKCVYCGCEAESLDHVKPRTKGGLSNASNLVPACRRCNKSKSTLNWLDWYKTQEFFSELNALRIQAWTQKLSPYVLERASINNASH